VVQGCWQQQQQQQQQRRPLRPRQQLFLARQKHWLAPLQVLQQV
jgi:hypothetical protein